MSNFPSIGPLASIAGTLLSQRTAETDRTAQETAAQERKLDSSRRAVKADAIDATSGENTDPHERDADGRRLWESTEQKSEESLDEKPPGPAPNLPSGGQLDLLA